MINFSRKDKTVTQASPRSACMAPFLSFVWHFAGQRGYRGVTNVYGWVISSWLYNKQNGMKFRHRSRTVPPPPMTLIRKTQTNLALDILPEVASQFFTLSLSVHPSVIVKFSAVMSKVKTSFGHYYQIIQRQTIESCTSWKFPQSKAICYWPTDWPKCFSLNTSGCEKLK